MKRMDKVEEEVGTLHATLTGIQSKLSKQDTAIVNNSNSSTNIRAENNLLREEVACLSDSLNEQIDINLRSHLSFVGIERKPDEKTWDDTTEVLARWLADHTDMTHEYISENIIRCHRGPNFSADLPPFVECGFTWKVADTIFKELGTVSTDGVMVRQKFSKATQERRNRALIKRKALKTGVGRDWKIFLKFPATLLAKKPGDNAYKIIEKF